MAMKRNIEQTTVEGNAIDKAVAKKQRTQNQESSPQNQESFPQNRYSLHQLAQINPSSFVASCLKAYGLASSELPENELKGYFLQPSDEHIEAYATDVIQAIRQNDVKYLRTVRKEGRSLQACNNFGESLSHLACRRSSVELIRFLLEEGNVSLRVRDDYGRTPLHDALWRKEPDFELVSLILDHEPELLMISDKRGHLPLDYCRREHWGQWIYYLADRMKIEIRRKLSSI
ncbi:hypothetical protein CTEN210_11579 [Chaetoceros tenuissimus]|uniref:Uncharacterized protein n=1 Tax=Chaetoceros tenuissimus TaxID=426638 RepID=A0AAD3CZK6_9STRA|nr:hypothetical protein CTEN210_11579 [Chaetoceros tenuissimus]